jgi:hypothetical protein
MGSSRRAAWTETGLGWGKDVVTYKRHVHLWHQVLHQPLLDVERLEQAREPRREDRVHLVHIVQPDQKSIDSLRSVCLAHCPRSEHPTHLGLKVAQERRGDRAHSLAVPASFAYEREAMQYVEQGPLTGSVPRDEQRMTRDCPGHVQVDLDVVT